MTSTGEPAPRAHADVLGACTVALAVCLVDAVGVAQRPPGFPVGSGLVVLVALGVALGTSLGAVTLVARSSLRHALQARGGTGHALCGIADAVVLYGLVLQQDPRALQGDRRMLALTLVVIVGAGVGRFLPRCPLVVQRLVAALALAAAAAFAESLRWMGEPWLRLTAHAVIFVAGTFLLGPLTTRFATRRTTLAVLAACLVLFAAADPVLEASRSARHALWGRSAHVWTWAALVTAPLDRDDDGAVAWLGGRDCDPHRASVHPGASEIAGNGRDEDCSGSDARPPPPAALARPSRPAVPPDLLLVSIDSLRWDVADSLSEVGRALGPHARFTRAVTPASKTANTLASFARGRPARQVRFEKLDDVRGLAVWRDPTPTFGPPLSDLGYRAVTVPTDAYLDPRYGVAPDLEVVYAANHAARGLGLTWHPFSTQRLFAKPALEVLLRVARDTRGPLCAWIHLMDSHSPFYWAPGRSGPKSMAGLKRSARAVDLVLARFLREMTRARGRRPTVAIFGDHGEEFGEHGGGAHGGSVHAEQVRVTLLLAGEGIPAGRFDAPVSVSSLPATFLELAGASVPPTMTEPSLLGALRGDGAWPEVAVSESWAPTRTWVGYTFERHRLLLEPTHDLVELYDADRDPYERVDLAPRRPDLLRTLVARARRWDDAH